MRLKLLILTLIAVAMTAWARRDEVWLALHGPVPDPGPPQAAVLILGDSTMTPIYDGERDVPALASEMLGGALLDNRAVGGTTVQDAPLALIKATRAPLVVANYAINDSHLGTPEAYRAGLLRLIEACTAAGKRLILLQSNPMVPGGRVYHLRPEPPRAAFEAVKREVAAARGITYCTLPPHDWALADAPDGVHPGLRGKQLIAAALVRCLRDAGVQPPG